MADAATEALREQRYGSVDEFVPERLGYPGGANEFLNSVSAEQVDAIVIGEWRQARSADRRPQLACRAAHPPPSSSLVFYRVFAW